VHKGRKRKRVYRGRGRGGVRLLWSVSTPSTEGEKKEENFKKGNHPGPRLPRGGKENGRIICTLKGKKEGKKAGGEKKKKKELSFFSLSIPAMKRGKGEGKSRGRGAAAAPKEN